jgi:hypothetical protein
MSLSRRLRDVDQGLVGKLTEQKVELIAVQQSGLDTET